MENSNHDRSMTMFISSMLLFGTIGIFRRFIPLSSGFLAFSRGLLGGLFLLLFSVGKKTPRGALDRRTVWLLVLSGAIIGVNWILLFESYNCTTVPIATLCYYMEPTIVLLLSPLLFQEKLTRRKGLCALIAVLGMILVSGVTSGTEAFHSNVRGILFGLGAAILYSMVVIMNKKIGSVEPFTKTTVQLFSAAAVMIPYLLVSRDLGSLTLDTRTLILLLIVGIVHTGIGYMIYFRSIEGLRAQTIALFSYIDPVSALFFSAIFLHERLDAAGLIGAAMILGAAIASEYDGNSNRQDIS